MRRPFGQLWWPVGLTVDIQAGASRYRIDLAVRDLLRQLVLQRMGWRIHRVWSTEWFHDPEQAISGIPRSVEQAEEAPVEHPVYAPHPDPEPPSPPSSPQCGEALGQDSRPV